MGWPTVEKSSKESDWRIRVQSFRDVAFTLDIYVSG